MANWANVGNVGDPLSAGWQEANLDWIEPIKGQRWQVYKPARAAFEGLLNDLIKLGYHPTSSGGFNYRNIRGGNKLSQHAFGTAIDLNSLTNAMGQSATDIPHAAELAAKWGLEWGGNWKGRPDPMHFEYTGGGEIPDDMVWDSAGMHRAFTPEQRRAAIASIESAGSGDYAALGALVPRKSGAGPGPSDRAYGRYQVMGSNIGPWAEQYLKMAGVTPDQFLKDPALQDKLFDAVYGDYVSKYGERGAASKWFTGSEKEPDRSDVNGKLTGKSYADRYIDALRGSTGAGKAAGGGDAFAGAKAAGKGALPSGAAPASAKSKLGDSIAGALGGLGDLMGGGGGGGFSQPVYKTPVGAMPAAPAQVMAMTPETALDENRRNQLAVLMQHYWIT